MRRSAIIKGSIFSIIDQGIISFSNFVSGIIIARALAPSGYGIYSLFFGALMLLAGIQNALMTGPVRVLGVKTNEEETLYYFNTQLILQYILGTLISISAIFILYVFLHVEWKLIVNFSICLFSWQLMELTRVIYLTRLTLKKLFLVDLITQILRISALYYLASSTLLDPANALAAISASSLLGVLIFFLTEPGIGLRNNNPILETMHSNWEFGRWLLLETIVYSASTQAYLYFTALWIDTKSVGALSAVQNILNVFNIFLIGLMGFAVPVARKKLLAFGYRIWKRWLLQVGFTLFLLAAMIGLFMSIFARPILALVYSSTFTTYSYLMPIFAVILCFKALNSIFSACFRTALFPQVGFSAKLVSAILTVVIAYPLLKTYRLTGAAMGLLFTQVFWTAVYLIYLKRGILDKEAVLERINPDYGARKFAGDARHQGRRHT